MNQKEETFRSTRGLSRISAIHPRARRRLLGLGLTALLGCLLTIWVSRTTWQRVEQLEREFAALRADSFYLGVRMHAGIQQLNDTLLHYLLRGIFALSQVRYRYVRCFSEVSIDRYNSQFSMVDFVVGLGFTF
jgi:hypothetical protein